MALLFEALVNEKWDIVRYVCPAVTPEKPDYKFFDNFVIRRQTRVRNNGSNENDISSFVSRSDFQYNLNNGTNLKGLDKDNKKYNIKMNSLHSSVNFSQYNKSVNEYQQVEKVVHFEPIVAVALSKVIDVLLNVSLKETSTSHSRALNAMFFIFVEYNIYLEQSQMKKLLDIVMDAMFSTHVLRPGDKLAILRIFSVKQVKHYLQVEDSSFYEYRTLDQYTFVPKNKSPKVKRNKQHNKTMKSTRQMLLVLAAGMGLAEVVNMLANTPDTISHRTLEELLQRVTYLRQQTILVPLCLAIADKYTAETDKVASMLVRQLHYCMSDGDTIELCDNDIVNYLLRLGVRPGLQESKYYILRTLFSPPMGRQDKYDKETIARDLTRVFNFKILVDFLFKREKLKELGEQNGGVHFRMRQVLFRALTHILTEVLPVSFQDIWVQGLDYLLKTAGETFPELTNIKSDGDNNADNNIMSKVFDEGNGNIEVKEKKLFQVVHEKMEQALKWSLSFDEENAKIKMNWISQTIEILHEMDLETLRNTNKLHVIDGKYVSELL